jgi:PadR family transcriptional regulator PadR
MLLLSRIEEILLLAIWKLQDNAYGISIRQQIEKDTGSSWLSEAIYAPLGRLKKNGYVEAIKSKTSTKKGGRPRIYYRLTRTGMKRLVEMQEVNRVMWNGIPRLKNELQDFRFKSIK